MFTRWRTSLMVSWLAQGKKETTQVGSRLRGGWDELSVGCSCWSGDHLHRVQLLCKTDRPDNHSTGCRETNACAHVHGRRRLHADEPLRSVRLSLQVDCGCGSDSGRGHGGRV